MNEIQIFNNPEFGQMRTLTIGDEPWFVGKDVAQVLGYTNARKAMGDHVDTEDKGVTKCDTPGGTQEMTIINESGLYSLILSSKLPGAKKFKHWVTSEVLPSIRKHGAYMTPQTLQAALLNPDTMIQLCQQLKAEQEKSRALQEENRVMQPKALFADSVAASSNANAFAAVGNKGGTVPASKVSSNLADAINSISSGVTVQVKTGTVTGVSGTAKTVNLGFKPDAVFFTGTDPSYNVKVHAGVAFTEANVKSMDTLFAPPSTSYIFSSVTVAQTSTGFTVKGVRINTSLQPSNESNRYLSYIAIKYTE